jgi:alpha-beta hydrolase superfamily lysophospholipase
MLQGTHDRYSKPEGAEMLYEKAGTRDKTLVYIEGGEHSMLRFADERAYDTAIDNFLRGIYNKNEE